MVCDEVLSSAHAPYCFVSSTPIISEQGVRIMSCFLGEAGDPPIRRFGGDTEGVVL
jgi:hypothetical protein